MSGTFERLKYDTEGYEQALKRSTSQLAYQLYPGYMSSCDQTRPAQPGMLGKQGVSVSYTRPLIDIESDLFRINTRASKDSTKQYTPYCPDMTNSTDGYPCGGGVTKGSNNSQEKLHHFRPANNFTDYTRSLNPPSTLRGTGINRFAPLSMDPQNPERWLQTAEIGINNRMVVKDNHIPCIPKPLNEQRLFPVGGKMPCDLTLPVCSNYTAPLHADYVHLNRNWNNVHY